MIIFIRFLFIILAVTYTSIYFLTISVQAMIIAVIISTVVSLLLIIAIEYISHAISSRVIVSSIIGLIVGLILGHLIVTAVNYLPLPVPESQKAFVITLIYYLSGFSLMIFFVIHHEDMVFINKIIPEKQNKNIDSSVLYKILDTSTIIDGRIADICDTGFIDGIFVVPSFVVNEIQMVADSKDSIKRNRGRRGLDILNKMQKDKYIMVKITDMDFPELSEVDDKLVKLASVMKAKLITNDFNLNKVAEFHGVPVLNINQLSNALKPIVLPGEKMKVALVKEGKDEDQAIGYLDDGTMVVVENGRKMLNKDVELEVTSVLQTTAGRMIFAKINK